MRKHDFGGSWTEEKLERVRRNLVEYTKIFAKNPRAKWFTTYYVDAFAGTGYRSMAGRNGRQKSLFPEFVKSDAQGLLKGSARIALEIEPPFKHYLFIEQNPKYACELGKLKDEFPSKAERVELVHAEANDYLMQWCKRMDWRSSRAVVFLDPYGMQVDWSLMEAIAATRAIDLWLLFPLGVAVGRLLTKGKEPPPEWAGALTKFFGCNDWKTAFYRPAAQQVLFKKGKSDSNRAVDFGKIGQFFVQRLKTIFPAVAENPLPLMNSKGNPLYLLCFAAGNPKGAPTALRIADYILKA